MHGSGGDPKKCPFIFPKGDAAVGTAAAEKNGSWAVWGVLAAGGVALAAVAHPDVSGSDVAVLAVRGALHGAPRRAEVLVAWAVQHWRQVVLALISALVGVVVACRLVFAVLRMLSRSVTGLGGGGGERVVAFFHPYASSGGGGERVLWVALQSLADSALLPAVRVVVYTGDDGLNKKQVLDKARTRFQVELPASVVDRLEFVTVQGRYLLEGKRYPRLTLLLQALGSMAVGLECLWRCPPDVFIDTTGAPFIYPLARLLAGCTVGAYVHYPIISSDMLAKVPAIIPPT
jgi:hypothetical protein